MAETHESDLGGDSLSLSKSRNKISLMHDKIQQIKKKISGKWVKYSLMIIILLYSKYSYNSSIIYPTFSKEGNLSEIETK